MSAVCFDARAGERERGGGGRREGGIERPLSAHTSIAVVRLRCADGVVGRRKGWTARRQIGSGTWI